MGTDIYFYVEKRENGQWILVKDITLDYLERRNYPFFAILANVRNPIYYEDGGPHHYEPISLPKGVPKDASSEYLQIEQKENLRYLGESFSYLTIQEILDYDWSQTFESHNPEYPGTLTYKFYVEDFFEFDLPKLLEHGNPENVRILFHFS